MISVTAIQEAQQSAVAAFEDFMDACMDTEWQQARRGARREYNETVRELVAFLRKRDRRVIAHQVRRWVLGAGFRARCCCCDRRVITHQVRRLLGSL